MELKRFINKNIGLCKKIGDRNYKIHGTLLGCRENLVCLEIDGLDFPKFFPLGEGEWVPFYAELKGKVRP